MVGQGQLSDWTLPAFCIFCVFCNAELWQNVRQFVCWYSNLFEKFWTLANCKSCMCLAVMYALCSRFPYSFMSIFVVERHLKGVWLFQCVLSKHVDISLKSFMATPAVLWICFDRHIWCHMQSLMLHLFLIYNWPFMHWVFCCNLLTSFDRKECITHLKSFQQFLIIT